MRQHAEGVATGLPSGMSHQHPLCSAPPAPPAGAGSVQRRLRQQLQRQEAELQRQRAAQQRWAAEAQRLLAQRPSEAPDCRLAGAVQRRRQQEEHDSEENLKAELAEQQAAWEQARAREAAEWQARRVRQQVRQRRRLGAQLAVVAEQCHPYTAVVLLD